MPKIAVFHSDLPNEGTAIERGTVSLFVGPDVSHRVGSDGSLVVFNWETDAETGEATFPAGHWSRVLRTWPKETPPAA